MTQPDADGKNKSAAQNDLNDGGSKGTLHIIEPNESDGKEFDYHYRIGEQKSGLKVVNEEG